MVRLLAAVGYDTWQNITGVPLPSFAGFPVRFVASMDSSTSTNTNGVAALFGDLRRAMVIGRRRELTHKVADERYLDSDQIAILGTERVSIVVHDAAQARRRPIIALQLAAS
jgi:HK97 family phage major capsid protein